MTPNTRGTVHGPGWRAPGVVLRVVNNGGTIRYARPWRAAAVHVFVDDGGVCARAEADWSLRLGMPK